MTQSQRQQREAAAREEAKRAETARKEQEAQEQEAAENQRKLDEATKNAQENAQENAEDATEDAADEPVGSASADSDSPAVVSYQGSRYQSEPEGRIVRVGETIEFDGTQIGNMIVVNEDVYQEFYPGRAKRPSWRLLYRAGTQVPASAVEAQRNAPLAGPGLH